VPCGGIRIERSVLAGLPSSLKSVLSQFSESWRMEKRNKEWKRETRTCDQSVECSTRIHTPIVGSMHFSCARNEKVTCQDQLPAGRVPEPACRTGSRACCFRKSHGRARSASSIVPGISAPMASGRHASVESSLRRFATRNRLMALRVRAAPTLQYKLHIGHKPKAPMEMCLIQVNPWGHKGLPPICNLYFRAGIVAS